MPLYDFTCINNHTHESIEATNTVAKTCPQCGKMAKRVLSIHGPNLSNQDADWLKSVHHVIDKRPEKCGPATREFLKNPTRANHKAWMKERGITFLEPGEENDRPHVSESDVPSTKALWERHQKRNRLEVRTR